MLFTLPASGRPPGDTLSAWQRRAWRTLSPRARAEGVTRHRRPLSCSNRDFEASRHFFSTYIRAPLDIHSETASEFFRRLYENGQFIEKRIDAALRSGSVPVSRRPLCVTGECPHCQLKSLRRPMRGMRHFAQRYRSYPHWHSAITGPVPELRPTRHWYLPPRLGAGTTRMDSSKDTRMEKATFTDSVNRGSLWGSPPAPCRDLSWGVLCLLKAREGKVLYVWLTHPSAISRTPRNSIPIAETWWKDPRPVLSILSARTISFSTALYSRPCSYLRRQSPAFPTMFLPMNSSTSRAI